MTFIKEQLQHAYLSYFNDYLTIGRFAEHCEITTEQAKILVELGKEIHEDIVRQHKERSA